MANIGKISTPSFAFNALTGGIALGDVVCIAGDVSSGKTMMLLSFVANSQSNNLLAAFIDASDAVQQSAVDYLHIDKNLLYAQSSSPCDALDTAIFLINNTSVNFIAIDNLLSIFSSPVDAPTINCIRERLVRLTNAAHKRAVAVAFSITTEFSPAIWWGDLLGIEDYHLTLQLISSNERQTISNVLITNYKRCRFTIQTTLVLQSSLHYNEEIEIFNMAVRLDIIIYKSNGYYYREEYIAAKRRECFIYLVQNETRLQVLRREVETELKHRLFHLIHH